MSNYVKSTNFTSKDNLASGDPLKIVKGAEFDIEFNAIQTAVATKADSNSPTLTGTPLAPTAAAGTNNTQIATTGFATSVASAASPIGEIKMWPTASAPTGYVLCNGAALSRATYSSLFAVVGTNFGVGDGSTTFNVPDFRDRMPIGAGNLYFANQAGGSASVTLPAHTHTATVSDPTHSHTTSINPNATPGGAEGGGRDSVGSTATTTGASATGITVSISSTGSDASNANLPPYRGVYFIVRAL